MDAYGRKNQHRAKTLSLSMILGIIVIAVVTASALTSGIFERQMLTPTPSEVFQTNINNEVNSLKDTIQNIEKRIGQLSQKPAVGVEIEKLKDLVGELSSKEKKMEEIILQNPSQGSAISKASRTRGGRALHRRA
jgi:hypothetical protein